MTTLLVASSGGHLKQLHRLRPRLRGIDDEILWVTFDTPQARSLLAGEEVQFAHAQEPRDYLGATRNIRFAMRLLGNRPVHHVVSTGAGVALAFLPASALRGAKCHYIESATRTDAPSLTGRALRLVPGISLYTQSPRWADRAWKYRGSVFDGFTAETGDRRPITRVVVTLGTLESFPFPRLVRRLVGLLPPDVETLWQTGSTPVDDLGIAGRHSLPAAELDEALAKADVVIAHAGTGSALAAIEAGRCPVLVPRRAAFGEHIDDHQLQIAAELSARGLAIEIDPETLSMEVLEKAASRSVRPAASVPDFVLS